jgi:hypothetical protein
VAERNGHDPYRLNDPCRLNQVSPDPRISAEIIEGSLATPTGYGESALFESQKYDYWLYPEYDHKAIEYLPIDGPSGMGVRAYHILKNGLGGFCRVL